MHICQRILQELQNAVITCKLRYYVYENRGFTDFYMCMYRTGRLLTKMRLSTVTTLKKWLWRLA